MFQKNIVSYNLEILRNNRVWQSIWHQFSVQRKTSKSDVQIYHSIAFLKQISMMLFLFIFRVNCSFYFKIGACRHGDRCSRIHNKPTFSQVRIFYLTFYFFPNLILLNNVVLVCFLVHENFVF